MGPSQEEALSKAVAAAEKLPAKLPLELRLAAMMHPSAKLDDYLQVAHPPTHPPICPPTHKAASTGLGGQG